MTTEKRGSEKMLETHDTLCPLTEEELAQVAGGLGGQSGSLINFKHNFPYGIFPPEYFEKLNVIVGPIDLLEGPGMPIGKHTR